jgi:hypothetical protein
MLIATHRLPVLECLLPSIGYRFWNADCHPPVTGSGMLIAPIGYRFWNADSQLSVTGSGMLIANHQLPVLEC